MPLAVVRHPPARSVCDRRNSPNGPALSAPENSATVGQLFHELCREPVTRRASLGAGRRFAAHDDLHHAAKRNLPGLEVKPGRFRRRTGAWNTGNATGAHGHSDEQMECRAHRRVTAGNRQKCVCRLSAGAASFVRKCEGGAGSDAVAGFTAAQPEPDDRCHDCGVRVGGHHHQFCQFEECPTCGGQALGGCACMTGPVH